MPNTLDSRKILERLILSIIGNEENFNMFVFFFNRLENKRRPTDEIKSVLNDYLCACRDILVKGEKRIKHLNDRHILYCKENIGFIDINKIEIIANAVLNKTGIKFPITIHDFKRKYKKRILSNDKFSKPYKNLIQEYQEGDEIFEIISSRQTWKQLCGRSGIVLKRNGEQITGIMKSMN